jgi:hypothetical protein
MLALRTRALSVSSAPSAPSLLLSRKLQTDFLLLFQLSTSTLRSPVQAVPNSSSS